MSFDCNLMSRGAEPTMGRLSDKKHSARRPGRRERARVKKHHRGQSWCFVAGVGTFHVKLGRKKDERFHRWLYRQWDALANTPSDGDVFNLKAEGCPDGQPA
jgi:hypothetical protein